VVFLVGRSLSLVEGLGGVEEIRNFENNICADSHRKGGEMRCGDITAVRENRGALSPVRLSN